MIIKRLFMRMFWRWRHPGKPGYLEWVGPEWEVQNKTAPNIIDFTGTIEFKKDGTVEFKKAKP